MSNVFNIISQYDKLMLEIEELGGEITPEIATQLIINENELANKVRAYYYIIKTKESEINLAKEEQERLSEVRKVKDNLIKRLKKTVDLAVETFGTLKPSGAKGLDLGDLKVWQKKTEALEIDGIIDDERFCNIGTRFELNYEDAKSLMKLVDESGNSHLVPLNNIVVIKDKLKQWLIDNKEEHKKLIDEFNDRITENDRRKFEGIEFEVVLTSPDIKILLNTDLKHNSTVVFK